MIRRSIVVLSLTLGFLVSSAQSAQKNKPVICILGGTPSSAKILDEIPDDLKSDYHFISFNRPGFGGTPNEAWDKHRLFELATQAGLQKNDFAVIGVSGGGPLAILLANHFNLQHCGVISGMVTANEYFAFADSTFTKSLMSSVMDGYDAFRKNIESFPNLADILKQADSPVPIATRASYDDLHFILNDIHFNKKTFRKTAIT